MDLYWLVAGAIWYALVLILWPAMRPGGLMVGGAFLGSFGASVAGMAVSRFFLGGWSGVGAAIWLTPPLLLAGAAGGGWIAWRMVQKAPGSGLNARRPSASE